jgi:purine-cytosine permease-like protein
MILDEKDRGFIIRHANRLSSNGKEVLCVTDIRSKITKYAGVGIVFEVISLCILNIASKAGTISTFLVLGLIACQSLVVVLIRDLLIFRKFVHILKKYELKQWSRQRYEQENHGEAEGADGMKAK